jgi:membrane protease YdiL (CAAX protease family)
MASGLAERRHLLLLGVLFEGGMGAIAWALAWLIGQPLDAHFRWDWKDALLGIGVCLPMLVGFLVCVRWPVGPLARIQRITEEVIRPLFGASTLADLALLSILAGLGEELLLRGFIQGALAHWLPAWVAIAIASALFGLLHPVTLTYGILAALVGCYLGWVWLVTGNLLVVIVAHALYDFVALTMLTRILPPMSPGRSEEAFEPIPFAED